MKKPFAITLDVGTSLENRTGSWRTLRPTYVHKLPPCNHQCPAGEDIQGWLFYAESGNYEKAWRHLTKRNPLPSCMGRVCYHTCEGACNRGKLDASVGINSVERFLGDNALENGYKFVKPEQKTGKKVLIVGSGPAGLSAAYQLALKGHEVTIKEGSPEAGGDMVPGDRNVTVAIGHGYKAAYGIDCYLKGKEPVDHPKKEIATFESLNTWYYSDAPKTVRPMLDLVRRQSTFDEVQHGLTEENALFEARRCMSCGNCLQCDNCYGVCPDNAVIKTGDDNVPYIFNYDYCKGCGVCASECPCGAIKMEPESI